jgi:hypothetical protein
MSSDIESCTKLAGQLEAPVVNAWVRAQLSTMDTGDERRNERLATLLAAVAQRPGQSLPSQCEAAAPLKAAYRLLECEKLLPADLIASAGHATTTMLQQRQTGGVLLCIQDTTTLNFSTHDSLEGRGSIGNHPKYLGFHAHSTLLMGEAGVVHGLLDCEVYARDGLKLKARAPGERNRQPAAQKESQRWVRSFAASAQLCGALPQAEAVVNVADREADMYELFIEVMRHQEEQAGRVHLLVRAQHDRELEDQQQRLWAHLEGLPAQARWEVELPSAKGIHGTQKRKVEAVWGRVDLAVPLFQKKYKKHEQAIPLQVIRVSEPEPPSGMEPLEWVLLTTWPVPSAQEARRVVGWYAKRWQIEVLHRIWKSGCAVEQRRLQNTRSTQVMIVLDLLVAVMLLGLVSKSRLEPEASTEGWLTPEQCTVLRTKFESVKTKTAGRPLSIAQAVRWISQLGGHRGAPSSPPPGAEALWRGIIRLQDLTQGWLLANTCTNAGKR